MDSWLFSSPKVLKRGPCAKGQAVLVARILLIVRVVLPGSRNAKLLKRHYNVPLSTYDRIGRKSYGSMVANPLSLSRE
jgi:hypothetical protein